MPKPCERFDAGAVRDAWDHAADAYADGQATGRDVYRYDFFGPAQVALCGDVAGLRVLDVGCGAGYFAREMARRGGQISAIDISPRMIARACRDEEAAPLGITYHVMDAADLAGGFPAGAFDLVTSCLALQDMPEIPKVLAGMFAVLRTSGRVVAAITHPCSDTPYRRWERDEAGGKRWLCVDRYFDRGPVEYTWEEWAYPFTTPAMHATLEDWFGWIVAAGFHVRALREPCPSEEAVRRQPDLEDATRVPFFLMFELIKPGQAG